MAKITALSLHVINIVKLRRLCLGFASERLSILIKRSHGYILTVENSNLKSHYPPHEWPKLAEVLHCEVHDLLPDESIESHGALIDKLVISLNKIEDVEMVLKGMTELDFFTEARKPTEVAKHLFLEKAEQLEVLVKALEALVHIGRLRKEGGAYIASERVV